MNWNNIDLESGFERDLKLVEDLKFRDLLMEIDCNLKEIDRVTVRMQFEKDLKNRMEEARGIFDSNLDNIVKYAKAYRESV